MSTIPDPGKPFPRFKTGKAKVVYDGEVIGETEFHAQVQEAVEEQVRAHVAAEEARFEAILREAADRYLLGTHASMWGRNYDVTNNRASAVDFIVEVFKGVAETWDDAKREVVAKEALDDLHRRHGCTACGSLKA